MLKPKFTVGETFTCKVDGSSGYVVHWFRVCGVVFVDETVRLIPQDHLVILRKKKDKDGFVHADTKRTNKRDFQLNDQVETIFAPAKKVGKVVKVDIFYIVHLQNGTIKIFVADIMQKPGVKIISGIPLKEINLPGAGQTLKN